MLKKKWKPLQKGDIVDVIAPGYGVDEQHIEIARQFLLSWNLIPRIPQEIVEPHFLHANSDEKRAKMLIRALKADDSKMVWCLRGGYGSNRLLEYLDSVKKPSMNKLFMGISDITSLHLYLNQKWGWVTIHGPLLDRAAQGLLPVKLASETKKVLFGGQSEICFSKLKPLNNLARKSQNLSGEIIGGNLIVLQSSIGTPDQLDLRGKFLFIEEIAERGYKVDRALYQIYRSGIFNKCKGILIGDFIGGEEPNGKLLWPLALKRFAEEMKIPVWNGLEAGHDVNQRPVPFGTKAILNQKAHSTELIVPTGVRL